MMILYGVNDILADILFLEDHLAIFKLRHTMFAKPQWYKTIQYAIQHYVRINGSALAANLTFNTLLSLVPLLATILALASIIPSLQPVTIDIEKGILAHFIINTGQDIQPYLIQATEQAAAVSIIGLLFLLFTTIKLFYSLNQALQAISYVRAQPKTFWEILISYVGWLFVPILIGISIVISSFILSMPVLDNYIQQLTLLKPLVIFLPILLSIVAFGFLYLMSPLFITPMRYLLFGALFAAILFEIAKWLFGLYLIHFPSYQKLYGTLAAIPLFLIWLDVSWQIVLFGALVSQALAYDNPGQSVSTGPRMREI